MCLAVPAKIISVEKNSARVEMAGVTLKTDIRLVPGVKAGDYVLVHAGFAIEKLDEKEAKETLKLFRDAPGGTSG